MVGAANLLAELGIFGAYLIPRYGSLAAIPPAGFVVMYFPVLVACMALGMRLRGASAILAAGLGAGAAATITKWALALAGAAGHETSLASVDPARFFGLQAGRMTLGFVVLLTIAARLGVVYRRARSGRGAR